MPFSSSSKSRLRQTFPPFLFASLLFISLLAVAQVNLKYRMLTGYALNTDAPVNKGKPTMFVFEQAETFGQVFELAGRAASSGPATTTNRRPGPGPDFSKEMIIGIAIPPTNKPPKLSVSKVFVQDSMLTVRYISLKDTTDGAPKALTVQPMLLLAIPRQTVRRTRLVENGKVVQTIKKRESE